ncbi:mas-related G-protein coupled receptor member H-like, partial [Rhineura floridana]|uniref:mas-related G-protein coupled receptor member H-like n=1 Tax=Rhineura floridana TaxID=261503 RepID=UPI002AC80896
YFYENAANVYIKLLILVVCVLGLFANGTVIWILGFHIKKDFFTISMLMLAVADILVVLILLFFITVSCVLSSETDYIVLSVLFLVFGGLVQSMYTIGQLLLTAISIALCWSVLFPTWNGLSQYLPRLSFKACVLIWVFSFMLSGIQIAFDMTDPFAISFLRPCFIINVLISTKSIIVSILTLFIKISFKSHHQQPLKMILLTLLSFLFFTFPLNAFYFTRAYIYHPYIPELCFLSASINCSIKPLICYQAGRKQMGCCRGSMVVTLQSLFQEDEGCREEQLFPMPPLRSFTSPTSCPNPIQGNSHSEKQSDYANCLEGMEETVP